MTKKIAFWASNGGVGKTTGASQTAVELARRNKKVLLIDLDSQAHATQSLGCEPRDSASMLMNDQYQYCSIQQSHGVDVVAADNGLIAVEEKLTITKFSEMRLRSVLADLMQNDGWYDYIIIDCPPAKGNIAVNAIVACDMLIMPMLPEGGCLESVQDSDDVIRVMRMGANLSMPEVMLLINKIDYRIDATERHVAALTRMYANPFMVPINAVVAHAREQGVPCRMYDATAPATQAYSKIAAEIIKSGGA